LIGHVPRFLFLFSSYLTISTTVVLRGGEKASDEEYFFWHKNGVWQGFLPLPALSAAETYFASQTSHVFLILQPRRFGILFTALGF
jgi:hypothetical protein